MSFKEKLNPTTPKKILSCDGGGILGLISVEILAQLEAQLRESQNNPSLVLSDYFDFVCGTSTGAIIATCISTGMSMEKIRDFYVESGAEMFDRARIYKRLRYKYNEGPLAQKLQQEINTALGYTPNEPWAKLGEPALKTLLMMVLRNHTTDSPWPVSNNPAAKYNDLSRIDCNLELPLWQLVRASTAAPTFFPPEVVTLAEGTADEYQFVFVDGGVTSYNNPAFLAFQMATASPYGINWNVGVDDMLIVSVGTGSAAKAQPDMQAGDLWLGDHAVSMPSALMNGASAGWDMACRTIGNCTFGGDIDREFQSMVCTEDAPNWTGHKLFTYVRYDPDVSQAGLEKLGLTEINEKDVQVMDSIKYIHHIQEVGRVYAEQSIKVSHLRNFV